MAPGCTSPCAVARPGSFFYLTIDVTFPYLQEEQLEMAARLYAGAGSDAGYIPAKNGEHPPGLKRGYILH